MLEDYEKYEEEFRKLDKKEYLFLGKQLKLFFEAMVEVGFQPEQAFQLVVAHQKFIYHMGVEEFIQIRTEKMLEEFDDEDFDDGEFEEDDDS